MYLYFKIKFIYKLTSSKSISHQTRTTQHNTAVTKTAELNKNCISDDSQKLMLPLSNVYCV